MKLNLKHSAEFAVSNFKRQENEGLTGFFNYYTRSHVRRNTIIELGVIIGWLNIITCKLWFSHLGEILIRSDKDPSFSLNEC